MAIAGAMIGALVGAKLLGGGGNTADISDPNCGGVRSGSGTTIVGGLIRRGIGWRSPSVHRRAPADRGSVVYQAGDFAFVGGRVPSDGPVGSTYGLAYGVALGSRFWRWSAPSTQLYEIARCVLGRRAGNLSAGRPIRNEHRAIGPDVLF